MGEGRTWYAAKVGANFVPGRVALRFLLALLCALSLTLPAAVQAAGEPVTIGLEVPLSPPGDVTAGQLIRRGAELGAEYVNTQMHGVLGRDVALAVEDSAGQPEQGVAGYRRLVTEKHAVAVTGFFHSSVNIAVNEVAKDVGVPTLATQASAADITAKHYDVAFRTHAIDPVRADAFIKLTDKLKARRVALLAETTDYGIGNVREFENRVKDDRLNVQVLSITFDNKSTDLTPQLLQTKNFNPDLIINLGVGSPMDLIVDQATTLGLFPKVPMVVSYDAPIRPQWWQLHAKDGEVYFVSYYSPQQKLSPAGQWFASAYQKKYGEPPVYSALQGFGDVLVIAQGVARAKSTDPKKLIAAFETGSYTTWSAVPATFPRAQGIFWHNWSPPVLILHYTAPNQNWREAPLVTQSGKAA
ncbi:MAG: ABC transporter substrate-binding protein [Candidatus Eremiobacteraeota bacterium]|nr:ABC transporter substrate-binding protein [Candidatus Eremiobacteraeota bacterium]